MVIVGDCAGGFSDDAGVGGSGLPVEGSFTVDGEGEGGSSDGGSAGLGVVGSLGSVGEGAGGSFDDVDAGGSRLGGDAGAIVGRSEVV